MNVACKIYHQIREQWIPITAHPLFQSIAAELALPAAADAEPASEPSGPPAATAADARLKPGVRHGQSPRPQAPAPSPQGVPKLEWQSPDPRPPLQHRTWTYYK